MIFEIVLTPDREAVLVSEIADLIANAIHPQPPEGSTESYLTMHTEVQNEHRSALMANIRYGNLVALSPKTKLPTDENNPAGFVTVAAFIKYAAQFNIGVRVAAPADMTRPGVASGQE